MGLPRNLILPAEPLIEAVKQRSKIYGSILELFGSDRRDPLYRSYCAGARKGRVNYKVIEDVCVKVLHNLPLDLYGEDIWEPTSDEVWVDKIEKPSGRRCRNGHKLISSNVVRYKKGGLRCLTCKVATEARYRARLREAEVVAKPEKTHCVRGHALTEDNVVIYDGDKKRCRTCKRNTQRGVRARAAALASVASETALEEGAA